MLDAWNSVIVRLVDEGQNYVTFLIDHGLIVWSHPNLKDGWRDTRVLNRSFSPGGQLEVQLHNGYDLALKYTIADVAIVEPWMFPQLETKEL